MIVQLFNSSIVSGPEMLIGPNIADYDGEEIQILNLAESRLKNKTQSVVDYFRSLGLETDEISVHKRLDLGAVVRLRNWIIKKRPRIVHAHDVKASVYLSLATIGLKKKQKPLLITTHHGTIARPGILRFYEEIYVRLFSRFFDAILVVCSVDQKSLLSRRVPKSKIFLHPNGKDLPLANPDQHTSMALERWLFWQKKFPELPKTRPDIVLGAIARLSSEKRHDRMLEVVHFFREKYPKTSIALILFGSGPLESTLRNQAKELGIEQNVHFLGYSKSIPEDLLGIDLLLSLSDGEGLPMNLIEAAWRGVPFLGTPVGGVPDLVNSDWNLLVSLKNAVPETAERAYSLSQEPQKLAHIRRSFQDKVRKNFSKQAWITRYQEITRSIERE